MIESKKITQRNHRWMVAALIFGGLLAACSVAVLLLLLLFISPSSETAAGTQENKPAKVEPIEGTDLSRVILTEKAAERLDIQTAPVGDAEVQSAEGETTLRKVIPYAAVLYNVNGDAFVYTNPEPLTFIRAPITVDYIEGDRAVLVDGPATGSAIVTVGAAELFGAEFEFEE